MQLAQEYWNSLQNTPQLKEAMKETEMEWRMLVNHLPPEFIALSAYRCEHRAQLAPKYCQYVHRPVILIIRAQERQLLSCWSRRS